MTHHVKKMYHINISILLYNIYFTFKVKNCHQNEKNKKNYYLKYNLKKY